ncbi:hypothetical protein ACFQ08_10680, partial [Streptosporangium algeriense]
MTTTAPRPVRHTVLHMFSRPVEVWVTTLWPGTAEGTAPEIRWLSDEERARRARISGHEQRAQFTVGRALARRVLGERLGLPPR